jgi:hypothetical protein
MKSHDRLLLQFISLLKDTETAWIESVWFFVFVFVIAVVFKPNDARLRHQQFLFSRLNRSFAGTSCHQIQTSGRRH